MINALIIVVVLAIPSGFVYMSWWGWDRILKSGLRKQIEPDETVLFESRVSRSTLKMPSAFLGPREGFMAGTNRRLILSFWKTMLPVRTIEQIPIDDVSQVTRSSWVGITMVNLRVRDQPLVLIPSTNRFWRFSGKPAQGLVEALETASEGRIKSTKITFSDAISRQLQKKQ